MTVLCGRPRPCFFVNFRLASGLNLLVFSAAILATILPFTDCSAQQGPPSSAYSLQSSTDLVKVDVSVVDKQGDFDSGLQKEDFRALDNGTDQPIVLFTSVDAPAQILLLIETSPAVYLIHNEHLLGAYGLLTGLASDDQVSLDTYDQS